MLRLRQEFSKQIRGAEVNVFSAPPVPGIGVASGFKLMVEDRMAHGNGRACKRANRPSDRQRPASSPASSWFSRPTIFRAEHAACFIWISTGRRSRSAGAVSIDDVNQALQIFMGSYYVNNFNAFGRYWQVNIQAAGPFRNEVVDDISQIKLRNSQGQMVPLSTLVRMSDVGGPVMVTRLYNLYASAPVNGGSSSRRSARAMGSHDGRIGLVDDVLPRSMGSEWTDLTYMQIKAGNTAMYVFGLAVVFVFLALAALYESWSLPLAVILVVPMCLLCSAGGDHAAARLAMDIFVQIGFVVLVGLACKNAILIVEFARQTSRPKASSVFEATQEACRLRLRPILMTSFAFILGSVPMVIAQGAGAEMRWSLGTAVFCGMLGVTLFGIFLTPVFFYVIDGLGADQALPHSPDSVRAGLCSDRRGSRRWRWRTGFLGWKAGIPKHRWAALVGGLAAGYRDRGPWPAMVQFGPRFRKHR